MYKMDGTAATAEEWFKIVPQSYGHFKRRHPWIPASDDADCLQEGYLALLKVVPKLKAEASVNSQAAYLRSRVTGAMHDYMRATDVNARRLRPDAGRVRQAKLQLEATGEAATPAKLSLLSLA